MNLKKELRNSVVKRAFFKDYTYEVRKDGVTYHVLVLPVSRRHLVTINSKYIWDIKSGLVSGIRFKTTSVRRVNLQTFQRYKNKIIVLKNAPYKILRYINESEVVPMSDNSIYGIQVYYSLSSFIQHFNRQ